MAQTCTHLDQINDDATPSSTGCEDCLKAGDEWVHLRMCRVCGHIGCCDASPGTHATVHNATSGHPLISSYEPGEDWWYCYADGLAFGVSGVPDYSHP
jgi:hypothetical protein